MIVTRDEAALSHYRTGLTLTSCLSNDVTRLHDTPHRPSNS